MELFRITKAEYQNDLSGIGAFYYGGRWNTPNHHMLYTSSRRSLAMLETIVHFSKTAPPPDYVVVVLYVPDGQAKILTPYTVPDWTEELHWSQQLGDSWLKAKESLLYCVPSAIVKAEFYFLVNPQHPDAKLIKVVDVEPFSFDKRFFPDNRIKFKRGPSNEQSI